MDSEEREKKIQFMREAGPGCVYVSVRELNSRECVQLGRCGRMCVRAYVRTYVRASVCVDLGLVILSLHLG